MLSKTERYLLQRNLFFIQSTCRDSSNSLYERCILVLDINVTSERLHIETLLSWKELWRLVSNCSHSKHLVFSKVIKGGIEREKFVCLLHIQYHTPVQKMKLISWHSTSIRPIYRNRNSIGNDSPTILFPNYVKWNDTQDFCCVGLQLLGQRNSRYGLEKTRLVYIWIMSLAFNKWRYKRRDDIFRYPYRDSVLIDRMK